MIESNPREEELKIQQEAEVKKICSPIPFFGVNSVEFLCQFYQKNIALGCDVFHFQ